MRQFPEADWLELKTLIEDTQRRTDAIDEIPERLDKTIPRDELLDYRQQIADTDTRLIHLHDRSHALGQIIDHDLKGDLTIVLGSLRMVIMNLLEPPEALDYENDVRPYLTDSRKILWRIFKTIDAMEFWVPGRTLQASSVHMLPFMTQLNRQLSRHTSPRSKIVTEADLTAETHEGTLAMLLMNMHKNAYARGDARHIEFSSRMEDGLIVIRAEDDGTGVDPDAWPRIFEDGFSGRGSTGIGLASAPERLAQTGGTIECDPNGGLQGAHALPGARFTIRLKPCDGLLPSL